MFQILVHTILFPFIDLQLYKKQTVTSPGSVLIVNWLNNQPDHVIENYYVQHVKVEQLTCT